MMGLVLLMMLGLAGEARASGYDPLVVDAGVRPSHLDLTVHDAARNCDIPLRVYLPTNTASAPVILFSHGLGGSRTGSAFLGEHGAARGNVAVFLQHPGSGESVWKNESVRERMRAMNQAASLENFLLRVQDVPVVLNQLETWDANKTNHLAGRLGLKKVGMSCHSFGAVTTEAVSGETFPAGGQKFTDPRIKAAVVFSPSAPRAGSAANAFGMVKIPWVLMTGTKDLVPIGNADLNSRLAVYPISPIPLRRHDSATFKRFARSYPWRKGPGCPI